MSQWVFKGEETGGPGLAAHLDKMRHVPVMPADIHTDIRTLAPIPGALLYLDPPYQSTTTGYGADLPRAEVLEIAERWRAAGARVAISEAEPMPFPGWHRVRIDGERHGASRTFSAQQAEWLTLSHPPAWTPPAQGALFVGASLRPTPLTPGAMP